MQLYRWKNLPPSSCTGIFSFALHPVKVLVNLKIRESRKLQEYMRTIAMQLCCKKKSMPTYNCMVCAPLYSKHTHTSLGCPFGPLSSFRSSERLVRTSPSWYTGSSLVSFIQETISCRTPFHPLLRSRKWAKQWNRQCPSPFMGRTIHEAAVNPSLPEGTCDAEEEFHVLL